MSYIKKVDGVDVPMTPEEIAERQAEEQSFEASKLIKPLDVQLADLILELPEQVQFAIAHYIPAAQLLLSRGELEKLGRYIQSLPVDAGVKQAILAKLGGG